MQLVQIIKSDRLGFTKFLIFILAYLNVTDIVCTYVALGNGVEEANPFSLWLIEQFGFIGLTIYKMMWIPVLWAFRQKLSESNECLWLLSIAVLVYTWLLWVHAVGFYNLTLIN